jgi:hypothetical protein
MNESIAPCCRSTSTRWLVCSSPAKEAAHRRVGQLRDEIPRAANEVRRVSGLSGCVRTSGETGSLRIQAHAGGAKRYQALGVGFPQLGIAVAEIDRNSRIYKYL